MNSSVPNSVFRRKTPIHRMARNLSRWMSIDYFKSMKRRLWVLEVTVDTLLSSPTFVPDDTKAFNGQAGRQQIFEALMHNGGFECIVETGTFIGNTTGWMHNKTRLPVHSSEIDPNFFRLARKRLEQHDAIHLHEGGSVDFLRRLSASPARQRPTFFYLDAHWYRDLPLAAELQIISDHWKNFVIMIDDFEVPGDEGYGFDDYGFGQSLTLSVFRRHFERLSLVPYFPALAAERESGARSGCVVLARRDSPESGLLDSLAIIKAAR